MSVCAEIDTRNARGKVELLHMQCCAVVCFTDNWAEDQAPPMDFGVYPDYGFVSGGDLSIGCCWTLCA